MLNYYLLFLSKNLHNLVHEVVPSFYSEELFEIFLKEYINIRFYNYYDDELSMEEKIEKYLNRIFLKLIKDYPSEEEKLTNMYMSFSYLMLIDNQSSLSDDTVIGLITDYRKDIGLEDNKIFPRSIKKQIESFKNKKKELLDYFLTDKFSVVENNTSNNSIIDIKMNYNIEFPEIYSKSAIDEIYNSTPVSEERMLVIYSLVIPKIIMDLDNYIYDRYYLVDFSCEIFNNNELLEKVKKFTVNDIFKFRVVFKIEYDDYSKHSASIKEMIKDGYMFAIKIDDEVELINNMLLNLFKYILIDSNSIHKDVKNDKIVIVG